MNTYKIKIDTLSMAIAISMLLIVIVSFSNSDLILARLRYLAVPIGIASFLILHHCRPFKFGYIVLLSAIAAAMSFFGFFSGGQNIYYQRYIIFLIFLISIFFIAKMIVDRNILYFFSFISYITVIPVTLNFLLTDDPLVDMSSYNAIGSLLLATCAAFTIAAKNEKGTTLVYPAIITLIMSIFLYGRANIVASGIILFFTIIDGRKLTTMLFALTGYIVMLHVFNFNFYNDFLLQYTKFSQAGMGSERYEIWASYISAIDTRSFFFGLPPEDIPLIHDRWNNNPHSAFIRLFGVFGLLPFLILAIWVIISKWERFNLVGAGCLLAILFRSMTDVVFVGNPLDLYFFIIFLSFIRGPTHNIYPKHYLPQHTSEANTTPPILVT